MHLGLIGSIVFILLSGRTLVSASSSLSWDDVLVHTLGCSPALFGASLNWETQARATCVGDDF